MFFGQVYFAFNARSLNFMIQEFRKVWGIFFVTHDNYNDAALLNMMIRGEQKKKNMTFN